MVYAANQDIHRFPHSDYILAHGLPACSMPTTLEPYQKAMGLLPP